MTETSMFDSTGVVLDYESYRALKRAATGDKLHKPLKDAAHEYVKWAEDPGHRLYMGIPELDTRMRGIGPSELCLLQGFTHAGKTQIITNMLVHDPSKRLALFTPDETRVLILVKLACIVNNVSAEEIDRLLVSHDPAGKQMLMKTAEHFPTLAVFDEGLTLPEMEQACDELRSEFGGLDGSIFDYADLLKNNGEDARNKITALKSFGKDQHLPNIVLHQSSRTAGRDGQRVRIDSGGYGGEQQATFVIGVRRKKYEFQARIDELSKNADKNAEAIADAEYQLAVHEHTITVNLVKNKRPPSRLVEDVDFRLEQNTGRMIPMNGSSVTPLAKEAIASNERVRHATTSAVGQLLNRRSA